MKNSFFYLIFFIAAPILADSMTVGVTEPGVSESVLLVTVDTVRADRLGCYGDSGARTYCMDNLSRSGRIFSSAVTDVPLTLPSHVSILSGMPSTDHGVSTNGSRVTDVSSFFPVRLKRLGYSTAAAVSSYTLCRKFGLEQAFDGFDDRMERSPSGYESERTAESTIKAATSLLRGMNPPLFLWLHLYDPHAPYEPPAEYTGISRDAYDGELSYMFRMLEKFLYEFIRHAGNSARIVIVSDHGEALGSHDEMTHGVFLYQDTIRLACVEARPGIARGSTIESAILPSYEVLCRITGFCRPQKKTPSNAVFLQSDFAFDRYGWSPLSGVLMDGWKYIEAPQPELYNLSEDPGESINRVKGSLEETRVFSSMHAVLRSRRKSPSPVAVDSATKAQLESLGYAVPGNSGSQVSGLPDPKSRAVILRPLEEALEWMRQGRDEKASVLFRDVLQADPDNPVANNNMGIIRLQKNMPRQAQAYFTKSLETKPDDPQVMMNYSMACRMEGNYREAERTLRRAISVQPDFAAAYINMAVVLYHTGRKHEAAVMLKKGTDLDPGLGDLPQTVELRDRLAVEIGEGLPR